MRSKMKLACIVCREKFHPQSFATLGSQWHGDEAAKIRLKYSQLSAIELLHTIINNLTVDHYALCYICFILIEEIDNLERKLGTA